MINYFLKIYDNDVEAIEVDLGLGLMQKLAVVHDEPEWNCLVVKLSDNLIMFYVGTPQERANTLFNVSSHGLLTSRVLVNLGFVPVQNNATLVSEFIVKNYRVFGEEEAFNYFSPDEYRRAFETIRIPCPAKVMLRIRILGEAGVENHFQNNQAQFRVAGRPINEIRMEPEMNLNGWGAVVVPEVDVAVPELFHEPDVEEDNGF